MYIHTAFNWVSRMNTVFELKTSYLDLAKSIALKLKGLWLTEHPHYEALAQAQDEQASKISVKDFFGYPAFGDAVAYSLSPDQLNEYGAYHRAFEANHLALFARQHDNLVDRVTLSDHIAVSHEELDKGDLFVWCGEIMYYDGEMNTFTVTDELFYEGFTFNYEGEPAYVVGNIKEC